MRIVLANHSSYPRVSSAGDGTRLRRAYANRETGKITDTDYDEVARDYTAEIIREQQDAGSELVTDGIVTWYDLMSRPASRLAGVEINGIVRLFDTNTYVRQPVIVGPISGSFGLADEFTKATDVANGAEVKAIVTGPYTLARHSIIKTDADISSVARAYAEALRNELVALDKAGARFVQIEEPSLLKHPEDAALVRTLLERALESKGNLHVSLATYFGDATTIYGELLKMPVDMIALDLIYGTQLIEAILHDGTKPLALGIVDGRNTKPDDVATTSDALRRIIDALDTRGVSEVHLQPSCGLEFLPRDRAKRKLERMREIKEAL